MTELDLRCYLVTGSPTERVVDVAAAAARGGAGVVQVRSKPISARALTALTQAVARAVAVANPATRVLVDDRVDVAALLMRRGENIHGVHVGQDDLDVRDVRRLLGPEAIIGLTTGTMELVRAVEPVSDVIDYVGCGPFRATPTKESGREPLGLAAYPGLVAACPVPMVAIGDVTADDAADLSATGVAGAAIVRGLMNAADPEEYARRVVTEFAR